MATLNQGLGVKAGGSGGGGGGTDTNLGNTDLSADAARTYDVNGNDLTFENGTTNILQLDESGNSVKIGGASPYTMPTARGTINEVLGLSDSSGTAAWRTQTDTIKYRAQNQGGFGLNRELAPTATNPILVGHSGTLVNTTAAITDTTLVVTQLSSYFTPIFQVATSASEATMGTGNDRFFAKIGHNTLSYSGAEIHWYVLRVDTSGNYNPTACSFTRVGASTTYNLPLQNRVGCYEINPTELAGDPATCYWAYLGFIIVAKAYEDRAEIFYTNSYLQDTTINTAYS